MSNNQVFEKSAVIHIQFRQWSGACVFDASDFTGELPPEEVTASRGNKKLVDPKTLKVFANIKERAKTSLLNVGVPFLEGYLIPLDKLNAVKATLDEFIKEYEAERDAFCANLEQYQRDWRLSYPEFEGNLARAAKSPEYVAERISASYSAVAIQPLGDAAIHVNGLVDNILSDVVSRARLLLKQSLTGDTASNRVRGSIVKMLNKLSGLSFINSDLERVEELVRRILGNIPEHGPVTGAAFVTLTAAMQLVADEDLLGKIMKGELALDDVLANAGISLPDAPVLQVAPVAKPQATVAVQAAPAAPAAVESSEEKENLSLFEGLDDLFQEAKPEATQPKSAQQTKPAPIPVQENVVAEVQATPAAEPVAEPVVEPKVEQPQVQSQPQGQEPEAQVSEDPFAIYGEVPPEPDASWFNF